MRHVGFVKWFGGYDNYNDRDNDYGFISRSGTTDIFVHKNQILCELSLIREGTAVTFSIATNPKNNKEQAMEVILLANETDSELLRTCFLSENSRLYSPVAERFLETLTQEEVKSAVEEKARSLSTKPHVLQEFLDKLPPQMKKHVDVAALLGNGAAVAFYQQQKSANANQGLTDHFTDVQVVGVTFDNRQAVVATLKNGDMIQLRREPSNPYDRNAIRVENRDGNQIGYISKMLATSLAPLMDQYGRPIDGTVSAVYGGRLAGSSLGVRISFRLPESTSSRVHYSLPKATDLDL